MSATPFEIKTGKKSAVVWNHERQIPLKRFTGKSSRRLAAEWLEALQIGYLSREPYVSCADIAFDEIIPTQSEVQFMKEIVSKNLGRPRVAINQSRSDDL